MKASNPCAFDYVKYRKSFNVDEIDTALLQPDAFWLHPAPRRYDDPLRARIRRFHGDYFQAYYPTALIGQPDEGQLASIAPKMSDKEDSTDTATANSLDRHNGHTAFSSAQVTKLAQLSYRLLGGLTYLLWEIILKKANPKLIAYIVPSVQVIAATRAIEDGFKLFVRQLAKFSQLAKSAIDSMPAISDSRYLSVISSSTVETELHKVLLANRISNYLRTNKNKLQASSALKKGRDN